MSKEEPTEEEIALGQELADELGFRVIRACGNFAIEEGLDLTDPNTQMFIENVLQMVIKGMPRHLTTEPTPDAKA